MRRISVISALLIVGLATGLAGCGERVVKVESGTRVVCTYGEQLSNTIKIVDVPASEARLYTVKTAKVTCTKHRKLEALYADAQRAIAANDMKTARAKLAEIIELDASFRKASEQASDIDSGRKPVPDIGSPATGSPTGSTVPTGTGIPEGPVASLATWVPDSIPGYKADPVTADSVSLTREYTAVGGGAVTSIVVVAEQYKDATFAKAAAVGTISGQYSARRDRGTADGRTLQFGTSGASFAAVAWNEGAVLVVVEAYSASGKASSLKGDLQAIAAAIIP